MIDMTLYCKGMFIQSLAEFIRQSGRDSSGKVYIQTHNFPDADAVASAFALKGLLQDGWGIETGLIYDGSIQRYSLLKMIRDLNIPIYPATGAGLVETDRIIIVDGCKSYKNVTDLTGWEIAVIDHHEVSHPDDVPLADIRPGYGACSTLIAEYYLEAGLPISRDTATALQIGLLQDTDHLTRGVSPADIAVFNHLYRIADSEKVSASLRNTMEIGDLPVFARAIDRMKREKALAFCYLPNGCPPALLGMLGDFLLSLEEITLVTLFARNDRVINVSFRNEIPEVNAAELIRTLLSGRGAGGGHREFAGGVVFRADDFNEEAFFKEVVRLSEPWLSARPEHYAPDRTRS